MNNKVIIRLVRDDKKEFIIDGGDWKIPSDGLSGFGSLDNNVSTNSNSYGDGSQFTSERLAEKDRTVQASVSDVKRNVELRRSALAFFKFKHTYKLYITYMGLTRWCEGILYKLALSEGNVYKKVTLQFTILNSDAYFRSYDNFGKDIAAITAGVGFPYINTSKGRSSGVYNFAKEVEIFNDGDVDTFCKAVFKSRGNIVNPMLKINGKYTRVLTTLEQGDELIIDFTSSIVSIRKNGVNVMGSVDKSSDLVDMQLNVGNNIIGYDADSGDSYAEVSIFYNKLYALI